MRILGDLRDGVGESPVWTPDDGLIWSVDITGKRLVTRDLATGATQTHATHDLPTALALDGAGGAIVSFAKGVGYWHGTQLSAIKMIEDAPTMRLNEAACDPAGRFWVTSMDNNLTDDLKPRRQTQACGRLYRLDDGKATPLTAREFGIPNTMVWSPAGDLFYLGDSARNTIWVWDYDAATGDISNRRVHVSGGPGVPDGSCVDADGYLWTARFGAGLVIRYDPNGKPDREITVPAQNPTATTFAGGDLSTLIVTSARFGMDAPQDADGAMFAVDVGVTGLAPHLYQA